MEKKKKNPLNNKRFILLIAFVLAVLSWIIVAGFINPGQNRTIRNVKIDYAKKESDYQNKNLLIVSDQKDYSYAEVQISGDGSLISAFNNSDITVYPDYSAVNGPGEYEVPLKAEKVTQGSYTLGELSLRNSGHSLRSNPADTIPIEFEEVETKTLPITPRADNITAAEGYFKDTPVAIPAEVTLTGPKSEVDRVTLAVAEVAEDEERTESIIFNGIPLAFYDNNGIAVETDMISVSPSSRVEVDVPILEINTIDLTVEVSGVPQGFDTEWLAGRMHLSTESLQVVGTSAAFDNLSNPYPVYTIDLSQLTMGWTSDPVTIELPEGLRTLDQITQVVVSFDTAELVEKSFEVSNLNVVNAPKNAAITPVSDTISSVTLIGPADQMDALLPENITVEIDAFDVVATRSGQQTIPARVLVPSANRVFATGNYPVVCDVVVESDDSAA